MTSLYDTLSALTTLPCYEGVVPQDLRYPPVPYVIIGENVSLLGEQSLDQRIDTERARAYLTIVDSTPHNVGMTRAQLRAELNPNRYGRTFDVDDGRVFLKRIPDECLPIRVDNENEYDEQGHHPVFCVDVYRVEQVFNA